MKNETRAKFTGYLKRQAELNAVENASLPFNVEPSIAQKIETRIQESSDFLKRVNIVTAPEQNGQKLGLGIGGTIAGRTNTNEKDRETTDPTDLQAHNYSCVQTNFDTHITYTKMDMWAKFPDFQNRMRNVMLDQQKRDLIMIGFNGTQAAPTTDRIANPLLQDVAKGWITKLREERNENIISDIKIGKGAQAHYANLDAAIYDGTNELLAEWHKDDTELVAIVGRELLTDKYTGLINSFNEPTERNALDIMISNKKLGGLPAIRVPYFPANAVMITRLDNLSIYFQEGTRRRYIQEKPERNCIADYQSVNLDFVIEDLDCACLLENIELLPEEVAA